MTITSEWLERLFLFTCTDTFYWYFTDTFYRYFIGWQNRQNGQTFTFTDTFYSNRQTKEFRQHIWLLDFNSWNGKVVVESTTFLFIHVIICLYRYFKYSNTSFKIVSIVQDFQTSCNVEKSCKIGNSIKIL